MLKSVWIGLLTVIVASVAAGADLPHGYEVFTNHCWSCHGDYPPSPGASLLLLQNFADGGPHGGGQEPFIGANLPDLAAFISYWITTNNTTSVYTVSGTIADPAGHGIARVPVIATSSYLDLPAPLATTTAPDGSFAIGGLPPGDFHVTPAAGQYQFVPAEQVVQTIITYTLAIEGVDFVGVPTNGPPWSELTILPPPIHVSTNGDDIHNGKSWLAAKRTVQAAINASPPGREIMVAAGEYHERVVVSGQQVYGGFAGIEAALDERDWRTHLTILDGADTAPGFPSPADGEVVAISDADTNHARLDGLVIQHGWAVYPGLGGGVLVEAGAPVIANCHLRWNRAEEGGGGLACRAGATPVILNNIIEANSAYYGGAIYGEMGSETKLIANNLMLGNLAERDGGGLYSEGDIGLIANNTIVGNTTDVSGAGGISYLIVLGQTINNVIAFNSSGLEDIFGGSELRHNCVFGNTNWDYFATIPGTNDLAADPRFVNLAAGNYRLGPDSPCVDAGDDAVLATWSVDLDGRPRRARLRADIGAYELPPPRLRAVPEANGLRLSWPVAENGFSLEYKGTLNAAAWLPVPETAATNGVDKTILIPWATQTDFFRLRK